MLLRKKKTNNYKNIISLGFFCSVASELRRASLRNKAYPFDWILSNLQDNLDLIENKFEDFLNPIFFECHFDEEKKVFVVKNTKYRLLHFLHDFNNELSIDEQISAIQEKYQRRIKRFYEDIETPTLFVRYILNKEEYKWILKNNHKVLNTLKKFNIKNDIVYINQYDIGFIKKIKYLRYFINMKIFRVSPDENDLVARIFLSKNSKLKKCLLECKK